MSEILGDMRDFVSGRGLPPGPASPELAYHSYVGVEVEIENLDRTTLSRRLAAIPGAWDRWRVVRDGSLRGRACEALFRHPLCGQDIPTALRELESALSRGAPDFNERTSVHVHVNATDMTREQILKMVQCYMIFEESLFSYVGEERSHSNYCLPLCGDRVYTQALSGMSDKTSFSDFVKLGGTAIISAHGTAYLCKYSALNLRPLADLGTLEFRHHPGTGSAKRILEWINLLLSMKRWAVEVGVDPSQVPMLVSGDDGASLRSEVFQDMQGLLPQGREGIMRGVREVQKAMLPPKSRPPAKYKGDLASSVIRKIGGDPLEKAAERVEEVLVRLSTDESIGEEALYDMYSTLTSAIRASEQVPDSWFEGYEEVRSRISQRLAPTFNFAIQGGS